MHIIDMKEFELSKSDSPIKNFENVLIWCEENTDKIPHLGKNYYGLDQKITVNQELLRFLDRCNSRKDISVSRIVATENINYVLVTCKGEDFLLDQFTSITAILLEIKDTYDVRIKAADFGNGWSEWLVTFDGNTSK
jgi:hypothetical protein